MTDRRMDQVKCMACTHWSLRDTAPELTRAGFAQCLKRAPGHTMSAHALACERFAALDGDQIKARQDWLGGKGKTDKRGRHADDQI